MVRDYYDDLYFPDKDVEPDDGDEEIIGCPNCGLSCVLVPFNPLRRGRTALLDFTTRELHVCVSDHHEIVIGEDNDIADYDSVE